MLLNGSEIEFEALNFKKKYASGKIFGKIQYLKARRRRIFLRNIVQKSPAGENFGVPQVKVIFESDM